MKHRFSRGRRGASDPKNTPIDAARVWEAVAEAGPLAAARLEPVERKQVYSRLPGIALDDEAIASKLRAAALLAMDDLEAQRESGT